MWRLPDDHSEPIITAAEHVRSAHGAGSMRLPETAIVFFMSRCTDYLAERYQANQLPELLPRFLNSCPVWEMPKRNLCFLDGGRGAPQAADTVETLAALGVKNIIAVGMCGAYDPKVSVGEIIAPPKAFVEEGTSLHYYESIEAAFPDEALHQLAASLPNVSARAIVSSDAVYRQTFCKEQLWREKGAVAIDMETSAVFSVARYLDLKVAAMLMVSDVHPLMPDDPKWTWSMTREMRYQLAELGLHLAEQVSEQPG